MTKDKEKSNQELEKTLSSIDDLLNTASLSSATSSAKDNDKPDKLKTEKVKGKAEKPKPEKQTQTDENDKKQGLEKAKKTAKKREQQQLKEENQPSIESNTESDPPQKSNLEFQALSEDLNANKQPLPLLDEVISEDELIRIAQGKSLPKRIITEKFKPQSTTDKIIELLSIHLADYQISRLEFEYLHELIDEIIKTDKKRPK